MVDKQKEILAAALRLFVEYGFHGTPTSMIAKEAGVANGTLFHYYKTKDELVVAVYVDIKQRMTLALEKSVNKEDQLEVILKALLFGSLYWALDHPTAFRFIQQFHSSPFLSMLSSEILAQQTQFYVSLIQRGIDAKIIKPLSVDLICILINSYVFGIFQYLRRQDFSAEVRKQTIEDAYNMLWDMIT
jgi:AcrR family transcriptional regulator